MLVRLGTTLSRRPTQPGAFRDPSTRSSVPPLPHQRGSCRAGTAGFPSRPIDRHPGMLRVLVPRHSHFGGEYPCFPGGVRDRSRWSGRERACGCYDVGGARRGLHPTVPCLEIVIEHASRTLLTPRRVGPELSGDAGLGSCGYHAAALWVSCGLGPHRGRRRARVRLA